MEAEEIKRHIKNLLTGQYMISRMPLSTKVIIEHLVKQLEEMGEEIDPDIKELYTFMEKE
jgi:hypothetical protein